MELWIWCRCCGSTAIHLYRPGQEFTNWPYWGVCSKHMDWKRRSFHWRDQVGYCKLNLLTLTFTGTQEVANSSATPMTQKRLFYWNVLNDEGYKMLFLFLFLSGFHFWVLFSHWKTPVRSSWWTLAANGLFLVTLSADMLSVKMMR